MHTGKHFEIRKEVELEATPEQVWEAIATGPGIDSWFMGRNQVSPGLGGTVRTDFGDYAPESTVTAWEPFQRFAHRDEEAQDGRFIAYEFLIEGRAGSSTVLRTVTSGFLPGDDWADEFEAMSHGLELFFRTLVEYVTHFAGRTATPATAFGPPVGDWDSGWERLRAAIGLTGDRVSFTPDGLPPVEGVVYFADEQGLGVRTGDALYRFLQGFNGSMVVGHHLFAEGVDEKEVERGWQSWLAGIYA